PAMSAQQMAQLGVQLAHEYHPDLAEERHRKAHASRRADLTRGFEGTCYFHAQGPDADAELIDKALTAFTKPHEANKPEVSRAERTYDAFIAMVKSALGHQECTKPPGPLAMINITVPLDVFNGQRQNQAREQSQGPAQNGQNQAGSPQSGPMGTPPAPDGQGASYAATQDGQVLAFEALQDLAPDSVLRRVIIDPTSGKPLDVGRGMRNAPEQVRVVAHHGRTTCAWDQGCDVPISDTEADHIRSYSRGGTTSADNIQPLCSTHNRLKWRREKNPHRQVWQGRTAHRTPGTNQRPEPKTGTDPPPDPSPPPEPDPHPRE
ncbi:HNH endonuclease signature motif containing protein, partial [Nocardiopsis ganjiahuensis]|uniref:HNH endonuclease signature motif containing protein n=1 Tax=Nocardiopsis ganjiahuensis TaxID=239984 RepID=UPI000364D6C0